MNNQTQANSKKSVVIRGVTDQTITLDISGEVREISNDIDELKAILAAQASPKFQLGEKIYNIGEIGKAEFHTIINRYQQESRRSFYLRLFLFVFVPALAIIIAYLAYQNWVQRHPLVVTVTLANQTPHDYLPLKNARITLVYGDKTDTQTEDKEATFKGIPASFRGKRITVRFQAEGFTAVTREVELTGDPIVLPVKLGDAYAKIIGIVKEQGSEARLENVTVSVPGAETVTDRQGKFELSIPLAFQRKQQRVRAYKQGYKEWNRHEPVIENEEMIIYLEKE
jgi:hypothetical protein